MVTKQIAQCNLIYFREAASDAGFNVLRVVNEPVAAALAYAVGQNDINEVGYVHDKEISWILYLLVLPQG